ncbi:MAG: hypothetical protein QM619_03660 [Micropruina sp.]|uniref:hypothetical protein n=1 Tax=Micropruina sp. TaxID=2737536 RepID=UPI0039E2A78F
MNRRWQRVVRSPVGLAAGLMLACLAGIGGTLAITQSPQQAAAARQVPTLPIATAQIVAQQITDTTEVDCAFVAREVRARAPRSSGTLRARVVTAIRVAPGDVLRSGTPVLSVSDKPLFAFVTTIPFFRNLHLGDTGADVKELESGLVASGRLRVADDRFGSDTLAAIRSVYRKAGLGRPDGFDADAAWPVPSGSRVSAVHGEVGEIVRRDTVLVAARSGSGRWECRVPAGIAVSTGDTIAASSDSRAVTGTVTRIALDDETHSTVAVVRLPRTVGPDASVTASVVSQASEGAVLTVPAGALYATADSDTAVRLVEDGAVREVRVVTGVTAGGWVEVSGAGLKAGMDVQIRGA